MEKLYPVGKGAVRWISTEWLEDHLSDKDLTILDVQADEIDYIREHIPGALHLSDKIFTIPYMGIPGAYAPMEAVQPGLRQAGLKPDSPIVVYSGKGAAPRCGDGLEQAMTAYSLVRFGHENVFILEGGIEKWKVEQKPLAQEFPDVDGSDFTVRLHTDYFMRYDDFRSVKDNNNVVLLDSRSPEQYEGQGPWIKPGHIPGAVNLPWQDLVQKDNPFLFRDESEIKNIIGSRGIGPEKIIICSGGSVRDASTEFLLFKFYLNYPNVRLYEGAFTEWTAYPHNPTVTGKEAYSPETAPESIPTGG